MSVAAPLPSITGVTLLCVDLQPVFLKAIADHESIQRRCAFAIQSAVGLGLPLARQFVEAHGGNIELQSQLGAGTSVTIRLPRSGTPG